MSPSLPRIAGFARSHKFPAAAASSALRQLSMTATSPPIVELRECELRPEAVDKYIEATSNTAHLRKSLAPLRLFSMPETGGQLHVATHLYHYSGGFAQRDAVRSEMGPNEEWQQYLQEVRPCTMRQRSTIFVEAPLVARISQVPGLFISDNDGKEQDTVSDGATSTDSIYEVRRYQLRLGYDTVPNFLELYEAGLPSKLGAAGTDPSTSLVTLLYSEVGSLNEVIEIWRHGNGTAAMEQSRVAARKALEWRQAIGKIAGLAKTFTTAIHKPTSFSPLR